MNAQIVHQQGVLNDDYYETAGQRAMRCKCARAIRVSDSRTRLEYHGKESAERGPEIGVRANIDRIRVVRLEWPDTDMVGCKLEVK